MKTSKMALIVIIGFFLQGALLACAGTDKMHGDMKQDTKMQDTKMQDTQMKDTKMPATEMKGGMINDDKMKQATMTTTGTMQDKKMMNDDMSAAMTAMLSGSDGHHAAGKVTYTKEMGKDFLVLSDIKVDKVPDGHIYLTKNGDRSKGIDLGILKQFSGNVSFALPAGTDPAAYNCVIVYCKQYHVEIGRAQFGEKM